MNCNQNKYKSWSEKMYVYRLLPAFNGHCRIGVACGSQTRKKTSKI